MRRRLTWPSWATCSASASKGRQEQTKALAKVLDLKEDMSNYHGVMKSLFVEHSFAACMDRRWRGRAGFYPACQGAGRLVP